jgi:hypothetical protein
MIDLDGIPDFDKPDAETLARVKEFYKFPMIGHHFPIEQPHVDDSNSKGEAQGSLESDATSGAQKTIGPHGS